MRSDKKHIITSDQEEPRVDWAKVDATTEEEIDAQALEDGEELIEWTPERLARAKVFRPTRKVPVSLRLDADIIAKAKAEAGGRGYQSRINTILRAYYDLP